MSCPHIKLTQTPTHTNNNNNNNNNNINSNSNSKTNAISKNSINADKDKDKERLLSSFKGLVRYSLLLRHKHFLKITRKGKELKALLQADDELFSTTTENDDFNNTSSSNTMPVPVPMTAIQSHNFKKKRALEASGMSDIILAIEKLDIAACNSCLDSLNSARLHACLECVHIACHSSCIQHPQSHLEDHFLQTGHSIAMDFNHCTVWCGSCRKYVYDDDFERILGKEQYQVDYIISRIREPFADRPIIHHHSWTPSKEEAELIKEKSYVVKCSGMRGLLNLGSTCFMNSIIQTLIHNPLFKAYFLSDRHSSRTCTRPKMNCMSCQIDELFAHCYANEPAPFSPNNALHAMWISQTHIAGYSQQDTHEFFISLLDEIHNSSLSKKEKECSCIVHAVFGGVLQSDVTCVACNAVSLTHDPILDLSLEIKPSSHGNGKRKKIGEDIGLLECLDEFTTSERLGVGAYKCKGCGRDDSESIKQLSMKVLPPVLAIQLKRFKHTEKTSSKIDTFVKIPLSLDMTPLTTRAIKMKSILLQTKSRAPRVTTFDSVADGVPSYKYELFAVVCHSGKIDTGHYLAYCRVRESWYLFDDGKVTQVDVQTVLEQKVYMSFYIKQNCESVDEVGAKEEADGDVVMQC